jgi:glycosyltransferase involved in cell wall biosynthesis
VYRETNGGSFGVKTSLAFGMPVYNEEVGIRNFLDDICQEFSDLDLRIVVVDDMSTDNTFSVIQLAQEGAMPLTLAQNQTNLGHGPSTYRSLNLALDSGAEYVFSADGDGHIAIADVREMLRTLIDQNLDLVEGVRSRVGEPWFRRFVTFSTRVLVATASKASASDANTPFRLYRAKELRKLLDSVSSTSPIPNLMISSLTRASGLNYAEYSLQKFTRVATHPDGSSWLQSVSWFPSIRFLKFCFRALRAWGSDYRGTQTPHRAK